MNSNDGTVSREAALRVLIENGVKVDQEKDGPPGMLVLNKDNVVVEARPIPDRLVKKTVRYFARKFDIPIHKFYD